MSCGVVRLERHSYVYVGFYLVTHLINHETRYFDGKCFEDGLSLLDALKGVQSTLEILSKSLRSKILSLKANLTPASYNLGLADYPMNYWRTSCNVISRIRIRLMRLHWTTLSGAQHYVTPEIFP